MTVFKNFELEVLEFLTSEALSQDLRVRIAHESQFMGLHFSGTGYFLTVRHSEHPLERVVCCRFGVSGEVNGITIGFVIFLMDHELTFECFSYGDAMPEIYRELDVSLQFGKDISAD